MEKIKNYKEKQSKEIMFDLSSKELEEILKDSDDYQEDNVQEVLQGSWKMSSQLKPILATKSLADCIGILVYDPNKEIAFLSHSDISCFVQQNNNSSTIISTHLIEIMRFLEKEEEEYNLKIVIFPSEYTDRKYIDAIYNTLAMLHQKRIHISSVEEKRPFKDRKVPGTSTVAYNSETGEIYPYQDEIEEKIR